ncbi:uncharacterized protein LOC130655972 [Hydractinia symbiolongicarpus]|uniref:uncharacterized protein LOC130655972 n=1 Tax=Hydractinia symbiolongicarpus TaxID=13093 RepID=UPI00254D1DD3|nr:uncharacterized protein LOC130655972 [Hydractinia symbiolongicarpus]
MCITALPFSNYLWLLSQYICGIRSGLIPRLKSSKSSIHTLNSSLLLSPRQFLNAHELRLRCYIVTKHQSHLPFRTLILQIVLQPRFYPDVFALIFSFMSLLCQHWPNCATIKVCLCVMQYQSLICGFSERISDMGKLYYATSCIKWTKNAVSQQRLPIMSSHLQEMLMLYPFMNPDIIIMW